MEAVLPVPSALHGHEFATLMVRAQTIANKGESMESRVSGSHDSVEGTKAQQGTRFFGAVRRATRSIGLILFSPRRRAVIRSCGWASSSCTGRIDPEFHRGARSGSCAGARNFKEARGMVRALERRSGLLSFCAHGELRIGPRSLHVPSRRIGV